MGREKWPVAVVWVCTNLTGFGIALSSGCATRAPACAIPLQVMYPDCRTTTTSVPTEGFNADIFWRDSETLQKTAILLGGSEGGKSWSRNKQQVEQLVNEGYFVVSLAYFGAESLPSHQRRIPLEYFAEVFDWLSTREGIVPNDYTLIGASRGAELALLVASKYPQVAAIVAIAPSSVAFPGPPTDPIDALTGQHSAWACEGKEVPFVPMSYSFTTLKGLLTGRRTRMFEKALQNAPAVEAAAIPVEKAKAPILLVSFTRDQIWPSTQMAGQIMDRLSAANFPFHYQHITYDAKHCDCSLDPCWSTVVSFLREQFKGSRGQ